MVVNHVAGGIKGHGRDTAILGFTVANVHPAPDIEGSRVEKDIRPIGSFVKDMLGLQCLVRCAGMIGHGESRLAQEFDRQSLR